MKGKSDTMTIKKIHVFYSMIIIVLFLVGIFIGTIIGVFNQTGSEATENCRKFCEFYPNIEFSHVDSDSHCYCVQRERLFDSRSNKTMVYTQIVDAGIITEVEIED